MVQLEPWEDVERHHLIGVLAFVGVIAALIAFATPGWIPVLDGANLLFHEAGHKIYGIFGETLGLYGGILGQLTFPIVVMITFFMRREVPGVVVGAVWAAENLMNIARYMADARARELPLIGGTEHDFEHIFTRWGVLHRDVAIAGHTRTIGWIIIVAAVAWLIVRYRKSAE